MVKGEYRGDNTVEIRINLKRTRQVVNNLLEMMYNEFPPFDKPGRFPDAVVPSGVLEGSLEHRLLQFYGCGLDSMTRADGVYPSIAAIAREIDLKTLHQMSEVELIKRIRKHIPNLEMGRPVETLLQNSKKLQEEYNGDPGNILVGTSDSQIQQTLRKIGEFRQFDEEGYGKCTLLMKNYARFGIWSLSASRIPIKADRHVIRIAIGTRMVEYYREEKRAEDKTVFGVRAEKLGKLITDAVLQVTKEDNLSAIDLDDAFWLLGSRLCSYNSIPTCRNFCKVECIYRPISDNTATIFRPGTDKRLHYSKKPQSVSKGQTIFEFD